MSDDAPLLILRRVAAFCVDFFPLMLILDLFLPLSDAGVLAVSGFLVLLGGVVLGGMTPGKRLLGLRLCGQGCLACREVRRLWPLLALGFFGFGLEVAALRGAVPPSGFVLLCTLAGVVAMWVTHLWPVIQGREWPHNLSTGFRVEPGRG